MAIHFISGKPGGGKSLYGLKLIFEELRFGTRPIVTNIPIHVGILNEYYQQHFDDANTLKRYGVPRFLWCLFWWLPDWLAFRVFPCRDETFDVREKQPRVDDICGRIHLIDDDEMATFFTRRPAANINHVTNEQWKKGVRPDFSTVTDSGVLFALDEVHIAFNSRAWADTGAEVLYYLSQHRKLGDDVLCITQSVGNVDKQFRSVAQDFTYIRNLGKEVSGLFRLPLRFVRKTYSQPPSSDLSTPMEIRTFALDANGLAKCYDTAKGVGIHGRSGADKKARKRGLHWAWFVVGVPLALIFACKYLPTLLVKVTNHNIHREQQKMVVPANSSPSHVLPQSRKLPEVPFPSHNSWLDTNSGTLVQDSRPEVSTNDVFCVGWCKVGTNYLAFTSDGETYSSADHELDWIQKRKISILGNTYKIRLLAPAPSEYQPPPIVALPAPLSHPTPSVNQADVTVIGQSWRNRQSQAIDDQSHPPFGFAQ